MNLSRIASITPDGTYASPHGLLYQLRITFEDGTSGQANAKSPSPAYKVGAEVGYDITGAYPGGNKLKIYANPENAAAFAQGAPAAPAAATPQPARQTPATAQGRPAPATLGPINGQTVGMAMKEALALLTSDLDHDDRVNRIITPAFWASVHEVASDIIRVSALLEKGKLAKSVRERTLGFEADFEPVAPAPAPAPAAVRPQPGPGGSVLLEDDDTSVPF